MVHRIRARTGRPPLHLGQPRRRPAATGVCPLSRTRPGGYLPAGFHADFFLQFGGPACGRPLRSLWHNGTATNRPEWRTDDPCYFDVDGRGHADPFLAAYHDALAAIGEPGHIALPTANHDFARLHGVGKVRRNVNAGGNCSGVRGPAGGLSPIAWGCVPRPGCSRRP